MMKYIIALILSFGLIGCTSSLKKSSQRAKKLVKIESTEFDVYVNLFVSNAAKYGDLEIDRTLARREVSIYMTDMFNKNTLALCYMPHGKLFIYVDRKAWKRFTSLEREMLMFHELGHCGLNLPHDATTDSNGVAMSIMHPTAQNAHYYISNYDAYNKELFKAFRIKQDKETALRKKGKIIRKTRKLYVLKKSFFSK